MQEAAEKFRKYAVNVERDLETLIFEMLDLIDSKTRTLRKLVKLHLHIKRASSITTDMKNLVQSSNRCISPQRKTSQVLSSVCNTYTDNISLTTSTQDLLAPRDSIYEGSDGGKDCEIQDIDEIEREIQAVGEGIRKIELPEVHSEQKQTSQNVHEINQATLQSITKEVIGKLIADIEDAQLAAREKIENIKELAGEPSTKNDSNNVQEITMKLTTDNEVSEDVAPQSGLVTPEVQHQNSPNYAEGRSQVSSRSSVNSYSVLQNLEGVLNHLQGCRPGDCGFYLDPNTFTDIVDTLKFTIASYEVSGCAKSSSYVRHCMGKCSTQPVLNVNMNIPPKRKTSSNPECEKNIQKRRIRL